MSLHKYLALKYIYHEEDHVVLVYENDVNEVNVYFENLIGKYNERHMIWEYNCLIKASVLFKEKGTGIHFRKEEKIFEYSLSAYDKTISEVLADFVEIISYDKIITGTLCSWINIPFKDRPIIYFKLSEGLQEFDHIINAKCYESTNM